MGPLRSALAARRQRRRRGVFVSLYRPCCGAAAAIARRRRGPAAPPPCPPSGPSFWLYARPRAAAAAAIEARTPVDSIFLSLSLPSRPALGPADRPAAALPLPSAPPGASRPCWGLISAPWLSRLPSSTIGTLCRRACSRVPMSCGCQSPEDASRAAHPPVRSVSEPTRPPCVRPRPLSYSAVAPRLRVAAAGLRLRRVAQAALLRLRAEGPQSCRELPLQGWLSCSRLDAA